MREAVPVRLSIVGEFELRNQPPVDVLVSIWQPDEPRPRLPEARDRLLLDFHDLPFDAPGLRGPEARDARVLRDFARDRVRRGDHVLLHCAVGASRSPAAALAVLLALDLTPERAIDEVMRVTRDMAAPNPRFVRHIDDAFGLDGRLDTAVQGAVDPAGRTVLP